MYKSIIEYLRKWNSTKTDRQKLQDAYLLFGVLAVIVSGLITFLNYKLGYTLVMIGLALLAAYAMNGIGWHLLSSMILSKISSKPKKK